jgi:phage gp36-like protein
VSAAYCSRDDLTNLGIFADALRTTSATTQDAAIATASDEMDGYLGSQYKLPLLSWGQDVRLTCVRLAVYILIAARGFDPDASGDRQIMDARDIAERWLKRVSDGSLALTVTDSANLESGHVSGGVQILSNANRGYQSDSVHCGGAFTGRRRR